MNTLWQEVRYAVRGLLRNPGFTLVAVITLALGIGANTAIFTVVRGVLLQRLPFPNAERLVQVQETVGKAQGNPVSYPNFLDWKAQNHSFEELAAYADAEYIVNIRDKSERVLGEIVTDTYFPVLGIAPALGRTFLPEENRIPGARAVAVIGHGFWERVYGSDPQALGSSIRVNGANFTIVGVAPRGFRGFSDDSEVWIPLMMRDVLWPQVAQFHFLQTRDVHFLKVFGLLKTGVSLRNASADMSAISANLRQAYPEDNKDRSAVLFYARHHFVGGLRTPLLVSLGAVGLVLLIACANVVNLILARTVSRHRELAVRLSLAATNGRLLRQLLTESLLLALAGAALGLVLAGWGLDAFVPLLPLNLPSFAAIHLERYVLLFACFVAIGSGVLVGALPTLAMSRIELAEALKEGAKGGMGARSRRLGGVLVSAEVALSLILLVGAGLLGQSLIRMLTTNPGFRPDHLATMRFYVPDRPFRGDGRNRFGPNLAAFIAALPGVQSAAVTFIDPFLWSGFSRGYTIEGHEALTPTEIGETFYQEIGPDFFSTMGIPMKAGREFDMRDDLERPLRVVVNEAFARRYWPGKDPIAKRMKYGTADSKYPWMEVIGVAGNSKFDSLRQIADATPVVYSPLLQSEVIINMSLIVRTQGEAAGMIGTLREAVHHFDPEVPVYSVATLSDRMRDNASEARSYTILLTLFASLAMLLALVGIYGVVSYWVSQRTQEMGIRVALGALDRNVLLLVLKDGLRLTLAGIAAGLLGSLVVTRALQSMLFDVRATDPLTFAGTALLLTCVALLAAWVPAWRATRVDPLVALRYE